MFWRWYDLWVGAYVQVEPGETIVFVCLVPTVVITFAWKKESPNAQS
jgi:hypothetical protein